MRLRHLTPPVVALGVLLIYRFGINDPYQLTLGATIGITAIASIGLTLAIGGAGQLALGQAGFMAVGAYATAELTTKHHISFLVALLISVVLTAIGGALVGYIALRLKGNYLAMATLAVGTGIYVLIKQSKTLGGANGYVGIPAAKIGTFTALTPENQFLLVGIAVVVVCSLCSLFQATRPGRELRALRDDEVAAQLVGISVINRKVQIFALCSALGGLAGAIAAPIQSVIDPAQFSPAESITLFVVVALGGMGSITGALLGTAIVYYVTQQITGAGGYALTALGCVVIVLMAVLPGGVAAVPRRLFELVLNLRAKQRGEPPPGLASAPSQPDDAESIEAAR
jgi:branched-chain amino acid transport system permease protein